MLERAGESAPPSLLLGEAVRELARREPALARDLDRLDDGYAAAFASVEDLLDAGYTELHLEPLLERAAEAASGSALARAAALLRVAAQVSRELAEQTLGHRSRELARASDLLRADAAILPTRALWIHGFADATGVQLDLLETLAQRFECRVWLDGAGHQAGAFGARLRERLAPDSRARSRRRRPTRASRASRHADPECEARAAAAWARDCLEAGIAPERIAIVARDLARHRLALRRQLGRFGVPFSGVAERGATTPAGRQLAALCELLERGGALPAERWLDGLGAARVARRFARGSARRAARARHRLARRPRGGRARVVARWRAAARAHRPRARRGGCDRARGGGGSAANGSPRCARRRSRRCATSRPTRRARRSPRAPRASPSSWSALGWGPDTPGHAELAAAVAAFERAGDRPLRRDDFTRVLRRALGDAGTDPLGGRGGGVQVLSVMEARARSFDAVRVIGLERGVFPRRVSEDPLLSDSLRRALRDVLPDLPVKGEGHEEERFLFAQLCAAAPRVHLSCAQRDATGRATPPSPLFERAPADRVEESELDARSPRDALLAIAREGTRAEFESALPAALAEARRALGLGEPAPSLATRAARRAARARSARRAPARARSVPRRRRAAARPRRSAPRSAVRDPARGHRSLSVAGVPVAHPGASSLRRMRAARSPARATGACSATSSTARSRSRPERGEWPHSFARELLFEAAREQTAKEGIALPGFAHALARCAAPYVEVARRLDASEGAKLVSVETEGIARVRGESGALRELRYKADRIDEQGGELRRTDWKTGKAKSLQEHRSGLAQGALIQAHAYAQDGARARYVYLDPELEDGKRVIDAECDRSRARGVRRERCGVARCARCGGIHPAPAPARPRRGDVGVPELRAAPRVPARRQRRADAARRVGGGAARRLGARARRARGLAAARVRDMSDALLETRRAADAHSRRLAQTEFAHPVAIEAGAGTGKTAILVARVLAWCLGPGWERAREREPDADPARIAERVLRGIVAITFTEAAAAEMDARIEQALAALERGERPVGFEMAAPRDRVRALRAALDQLVVETIHAYCRRLLAAHPIEAGLHPRFEVDADGAAAAAAMREAVAEQLGAAYERGDEPVLELAHHGIGPSELEAELLAQRGAGVAAWELARDPLAPARIAALHARLAAAHEALEQAAAGRLASVGKGKAARAAADALAAARGALAEPMRGADDLVRVRAVVLAAWEGAARNALPKWAKGRLRQGRGRCVRASAPMRSRPRRSASQPCSRISRRSIRPCSRRSRPRSPRWPPTPRSACAAAAA